MAPSDSWEREWRGQPHPHPQDLVCCQLPAVSLHCPPAPSDLCHTQTPPHTGPCVSFPGPPDRHRATKGETRRDDNYLHGSRCPQVSPGSGAPSAREGKCRGYCLAQCPAHAAEGTGNRAAGQRQKGNQDIVMATSTLEGGIVFFPKGTWRFSPLSCSPQRAALLEMPTMHKPLLPQLLQVAQKGL